MKLYLFGRLLLALIHYLKQYFDRINIVISYEESLILCPNGTLEGLFKKIIHSEIDVGGKPFHVIEQAAEIVDFSYPYKLEGYTLVIRKPKYKPHIFGVFQMFSIFVWITIISVLIAMPIISYIIMKRKYIFEKISFNIFVILFKQNSVIRSSKIVEKLLVCSWIVGSMIFCLSYDSVFLSFLSIPPILKIETFSVLALAVESRDYHCISHVNTGLLHS